MKTECFPVKVPPIAADGLAEQSGMSGASLPSFLDLGSFKRHLVAVSASVSVRLPCCTILPIVPRNVEFRGFFKHL